MANKDQAANKNQDSCSLLQRESCAQNFKSLESVIFFKSLNSIARMPTMSKNFTNFIMKKIKKKKIKKKIL